MFEVTFDPVKRDENLAKHGLDFEDAARVFDGPTLDGPDNRRDYGETRIITVGRLEGRMVVLVWTPRGDTRRVISMRKANGREQEAYRERLEEG